ncbi:MAG: peptidase M20, partial [Gammaproteobacteria bacterium]
MAASISWLTQAHAQSEPLIDWAELNAETLRHFQALIRFDTSDPPGNERPAAEYLQQVLES